jgi:LDH2 family malate/lactate/ureidoglycolate dehydrogenase
LQIKSPSQRETSTTITATTQNKNKGLNECRLIVICGIVWFIYIKKVKSHASKYINILKKTRAEALTFSFVITL